MTDVEIRRLWAEINARFDAHDRLIRADRDARGNRVAARSTWRPIAGQLAQIAFGALILLFVAGLWATLPTDPIVMLCGALLHLYGIAAIAMAGWAIARIRKIDFDRPLLESQLNLEKAEETLVLSRIVAGQPWWFLWIAVPVVLIGKAGGSFSPHGAATAMIMLGVSLLGMAATLVIRARLIRSGTIDDPVGRQLTGARRRLDEIRRFAEDGE
ncbi:MAG TPA: hypothetical protein VGF77_02010 [Allosphingosinicella sp.]|jgi:hypothetical protein